MNIPLRIKIWRFWKIKNRNREQIGEDRLKKLKFTKLLKLIQNEIQELLNYWNIKQVHELVQDVLIFLYQVHYFIGIVQKILKKMKN